MSYKENSFPLIKGQVNLTTGVHSSCCMVCVAPGDLSVQWVEGGTDTISAVAGDAYNLLNVVGITIVSGTFHKA